MKLRSLLAYTLVLSCLTCNAYALISDLDGDGVEDGLDNCPTLANPSQSDQDGDNNGDACDVDIDGDGFKNHNDNCPNLSNPEQFNIDGDAEGDDCDDDMDGDGIDNGTDNCPSQFNSDQADLDEDGIGNACDSDADDDGSTDIEAGGDDCNDLDAAIHPSAIEICDLIDNNCDEIVDQADAVGALPWYLDEDEDGFGLNSVVIITCDASSLGYVLDNTDCDDKLRSVNPDANELCFDSIDNDCDGEVDETSSENAPTWYEDGDGDGFGNLLVTTESCTKPVGYVDNSSDCNDTAPTISPDADELCSDAIDNNCNGEVDENSAVDAITWHKDSDGDSFGSFDDILVSCTQPLDYIADGTDCDDTDNTINLDGTEICHDRLDNDCDGDTDFADETDCPVESEDDTDDDSTDGPSEDDTDDDESDDDVDEDENDSENETQTTNDDTTSTSSGPNTNPGSDTNNAPNTGSTPSEEVDASTNTGGGVQFTGTPGCSLSTQSFQLSTSHLSFYILMLSLLWVFKRTRNT